MQGARNTRLKDFYAIWPLVHYHEFDAATFVRRKTEIPGDAGGTDSQAGFGAEASG